MKTTPFLLIQGEERVKPPPEILPASAAGIRRSPAPAVCANGLRQ
jgi:hypothetical protein